MLKRIVATALSSVIVFSLLIVPSYASLSDADSLFQVTDIFDWAIDKAIDFGGWLTFFSDHSRCPMDPSAQKRHKFIQQHTTVDGKTGLFYICEYCGRSAGEVGEEAYQQQVDELPVSGITSAGRLIWYTWDSFDEVGEYACLVRTNSGSNVFGYHEATGLPFWAYYESRILRRHWGGRHPPG